MPSPRSAAWFRVRIALVRVVVVPEGKRATGPWRLLEAFILPLVDGGFQSPRTHHHSPPTSPKHSKLAAEHL